MPASKLSDAKPVVTKNMRSTARQWKLLYILRVDRLLVLESCARSPSVMSITNALPIKDDAFGKNL